MQLCELLRDIVHGVLFELIICTDRHYLVPGYVHSSHQDQQGEHELHQGIGGGKTNLEFKS